jgi:transposase-like protein
MNEEGIHSVLDGRAIAGGATRAPDPEVVATAKRRQFSASEKRRIVAAADACKKPGELGALLRREGIYSSMLSTWRRQIGRANEAALAPRQRGPKPDPARPERLRIERLERENGRLQRELAQARLVIDVQKKVAALLGIPLAEQPPENK